MYPVNKHCTGLVKGEHGREMTMFPCLLTEKTAGRTNEGVGGSSPDGKIRDFSS
jgi:hypothetical protein